MRTTVLAIALWLWSSTWLFAQYMEDTSYTYADLWADDSGVYAYAQTDGMMTNIHDYAVDVTLRSPAGRVNSVSGSLTNGTATGSAYLQLDLNDLGDYSAETRHWGWCYQSSSVFDIIWRFVVGTLSLRETYYTDPIREPGVPPRCYFRNTACWPGSRATCVGGWGLSLPWDLCDYQYAHVNYLVWTRFGYPNCIWVGLASPAYGPGPCT